MSCEQDASILQGDVVVTILDLANQLGGKGTHASSIRRIQSRNAKLPIRLDPVLGEISSIYLFNVPRTSPIVFIGSFKMMSSSRQRSGSSQARSDLEAILE
jgi:hypothetical protein